MRTAMIGGLVLSLTLAGNAAETAAYWEGPTMVEEPVLFLAGDGETPSGRLLFAPTEILRVTNSAGDVVYEEGRDYVVDRERRRVTLPAGSRIAFLKDEERYPAAGAPRSYAKQRGTERHMLYSEDGFLPDRQPRFTYTYAVNDLPVRRSGQGTLPRLAAKLAAKEPVEFAVFGDSISTGCNATAAINIPPFRPMHYEQVAAAWRAAGGDVRWHNFSVGGMTAGWAVDHMDDLLALPAAPDFILLAWGMNDGSGDVPPETYLAQNREMMRRAREKYPETEFVLIATMTANTDWQSAGTRRYDEYLDALNGIAGDGVLVVDITTSWKDLVERKGFLSLAGNGLNHPNDFGHRVYADRILDAVRQGKP